LKKGIMEPDESGLLFDKLLNLEDDEVEVTLGE
jgi:hypothetical protein